MKQNKKFTHVSSEDMFEDINILIKKIKKTKKEFNCILCLGRGGMVISRLISEYLNIPDIIYYPVYSYVEGKDKGVQNTQSVPKLRYEFDYQILKDKKVLIVDDKYDTGLTIKFIISELSKNNLEIEHLICVWYLNVDGLNTEKHNVERHVLEHNNMLYGNTCHTDDWIIFPWESGNIHHY